jgi:SAM-dependent methyltransferase
MMPHLSTQTVQYSFFDAVLGQPSWRDLHVLDFGGNIGNLLNDPASDILPERYWCIDVTRSAIERGRAVQPRAHWLDYDRYNPAFNREGTPGLAIPATSQPFDVIVAYSVFSHTSETEMIELVAELRRRLAPGGMLAFSFIDPLFDPSQREDTAAEPGFHSTNLEWRLRKENKQPGLNVAVELERVAGAKTCTLVNENDLYVDHEPLREYGPREIRSFLTFFSAAYMQTLFPDARVAPPPLGVYGPPHPIAEYHHCCVLGPAE